MTLAICLAWGGLRVALFSLEIRLMMADGLVGLS